MKNDFTVQLSSVIPASAAAVSWDGDAGDGKF